MSPHTLPPIFLWIIYYSLITTQVMDFQKELAGWLGEATLFPLTTKTVEESPSLCLDDIINSNSDGKSQNQPAFLDLSDVINIFDEDGWMDENIDLSILDSAQDCVLPPEDDANKLTPSCASLLESIIGSDLFSDPFSILDNSIETSSSAKDSVIPLDTHNDLVSFSENATSNASILPEMGLQMPTSPADTCSVYSSSSALSPSNTDGNTSDSGVVGEVNTSSVGSNVFCIEITPEVSFYSHDVEVSSVNEIVKSPPDKLPPSSGKNLSLVRKSMKARNGPYVATSQLKKESRRERKKVQNKEAAARYRMKRREQDKMLSDEVAGLEATQAELQDKHDKLKSEISYLKSLMRDMFKARGLLK